MTAMTLLEEIAQQRVAARLRRQNAQRQGDDRAAHRAHLEEQILNGRKAELLLRLSDG